jgi:hypothetical protein
MQGDAALQYSPNTASRGDAADGSSGSPAARMGFFISLLSRRLPLSPLAVTVLWASTVGGCVARASVETSRDAAVASAACEERYRALVLTALEREAVYTLVGGLKPMSTGFWQDAIELERPDLSEIEQVRRALAPLRDGTCYADIQVFATAHDERRHVEAYVVHLDSFAAMIRRDRAFWSPLGITACTHPAEVVAIVDRLPRTDRWRAYGLLFGYPNYAIDFFVEATERARVAEGGAWPGKDRDFLHVPTASAAQGQFTWAVPLAHEERAEDRAILRRAEAILAEYRLLEPRIAEARDPMIEVRRLNALFVGLESPVVRP